jgi:hypothetical protein
MQASAADTTLSWIQASQYPYLKMEVYLKDDSLRSPPQVDRLQVYYEDVPECAVNPNRQFSFHVNPISEGDTARLSVAIDNIGHKSMDSLNIDFYLFDSNRIRHHVKSVKLDSLRVGETVLAKVESIRSMQHISRNNITLTTSSK